MLVVLCKGESESKLDLFLVSGGLLPGLIRYRNEQATWAGHKELGWAGEMWKIKTVHHSDRRFGSPQHYLPACRSKLYIFALGIPGLPTDKY